MSCLWIKDYMIIDKEEVEELASLLEKTKDFIEQTEMEATNVGMKLYEQCNDWLVKIRK